MSFHVRIDYTRTGDKATQKPSDVVRDASAETLERAARCLSLNDHVERVVLERD